VHGDYYVGDDGHPAKAPGWWAGKAASSLRLEGDITIEQLVNALDGRHPYSGERLRRWRKDRIAGWDFTISPPKCVSAVWAVADWDDREYIEGLHEDAVRALIAYAEKRLRLVRRGGNAPLETAAELLVAVFDHHTSRQTAEQIEDGSPPDPHLHSHMLFLMARRHDGALVAIHEWELFHLRQELEAVYYAHLATGLAEAGFTIERGVGRGGRDFGMVGVPAELCTVWSRRRQEITASLEEEMAIFRETYGRDPDMVEQRELALRCRQPKGQSYADPSKRWRKVAEYFGFTAETVTQLRAGGDTRPSHALGRARVGVDLLSEDGLTREHATITAREVRTDAFRRAAGRVYPDDALRALGDLTGRGELVARPGGRWTTRTMLERERAVLAWRDTLLAARPPRRPPRWLVWRALREERATSGVPLTVEQVEAVHHILAHRFTAVTGQAGTGKGVALRPAARVWRAHHRRVFAVAVAGVTAQRFAATLGAGAEGMTLDGLMTGVERGRIELRDGDVIAIDEAGMVDTRRWARFVSVVKDRPDITVVAVGDEAQLSPLSAGGLWPLLAEGGPQLS